MPHLRKLVVHSLAPDEPITPPCVQGTRDVQLLASMPHLRKLVVHSLAPDEPIAPPCAWEDLWIVGFDGDLRQLSRLPLAGLEALRLER